MKFWLCNPFDFLPGEGGRLQRYAMLSQALARHGYDVVWWSSDWNHLEKKRRRVPSESELRTELGLAEKDGRVEIRLLPTLAYRRNVGLCRLLSHWRYGNTWARAIRFESESPGAILVSMPPLGLWQRVRRLGVPVAVDVQDLWPDTFRRVLPCGFQWLLAPMARTARAAYLGVAAVSVVCESYRTVTGRQDARVFRLGVDIAKNPQTGESAGTKLRICYVGNLGVGYGISEILESVERLSGCGVGITLHIAGDGPQRKAVEAAAAKCPAIHYEGVLRGSALGNLLEHCDAGLIPMVSESGVALPNKLGDYAAAGLAVVSSLEGETQKLLERYSAGLTYKPGDIAGLTECLRRLAADRTEVARMRAGSWKMACDELDAGRIYPVMAEWLAGLAKSKTPE